MHRGTKVIAAPAVLLLAALAPVGPAPQAGPPRTPTFAPAGPPRGPAGVSAVPSATFRLAYVGAQTPTLAVARSGGLAAADVLSEQSRGAADADADARGGALVWVSRRPTGDPASAHPELDGDLYFRRSAAAAAIRLTNDSAIDQHPALSPDGRMVAFVSDRGGSNDIWLIRVDGTGARQLTQHPADERWPSWSPDGARLAFSSTRDDPDGDIYTMSAAGGTLTRITSHDASDVEPAWAPSGDRLAFTTARYGGGPAVATVPARGGDVTRAVPAPWDAAAPAWSPDGDQLAFVTRRGDPSGDVYVHDGTAIRPVARTPATAETEPTWWGTRVLYTTARAAAGGDPNTNVWSVDQTGMDQRDLSGQPSWAEQAPTFSANGARLAYLARGARGTRLVVADPDGRAPRTIRATAAPGIAYADPTLSPDGSLVAWAESDAGSGARAIVVARTTDGVEVGRLLPPAHLSARDSQPAWSPRGDAIAVARRARHSDPSVYPTTVHQELPAQRSFTVATTVIAPAGGVLRPVLERCPDQLTVTVAPARRSVRRGQSVTFAVRTRLGSPSGPEALRCVVRFHGSGRAADATDGIGRQEINVVPLPAGQPYVQVDNALVRAAGNGSVVRYSARAYQGSGRPLPAPRCDHPSGSRFPIGITLVTCTATDPDGRTARDRAAVIVRRPGAAGQGIWVAKIASLSSQRVTFGDQLDIGAVLRAPCDPAALATAPAWAPDGGALAFAEAAAERAAKPGLCLVDADGGNARAPLTAAQRRTVGVADPAWTPDGGRIAFADRGDIRTVPARGGALTTLLDTRHGASQPAFQRSPDPDLRLSISGGGPGYAGGEPVPVTMTVRNTSPRPATNLWVRLDLPASLRPAAVADHRCDARLAMCRLGDLGVGDQAALTVALPAADEVSAAVRGRLTGTFAGGDPATREASTHVLVIRPVITVDPTVGRPGFVPQVSGTRFPPGATVRVTWEPGSTAEAGPVRVRADGTFQVPRMLLREDSARLRWLRAAPAHGPRFAAVRIAEPFLVAAEPPLPRLLGYAE